VPHSCTQFGSSEEIGQPLYIAFPPSQISAALQISGKESALFFGIVIDSNMVATVLVAHQQRQRIVDRNLIH